MTIFIIVVEHRTGPWCLEFQDGRLVKYSKSFDNYTVHCVGFHDVKDFLGMEINDFLVLAATNFWYIQLFSPNIEDQQKIMPQKVWG